MKHEHLTRAIIGGAMKVHSALGPGLLESAYRACLTHVLSSQGMNLKCEWPLDVAFNGVHVDVGYKVDLLFDDLVIVELKAVERIIPVHEAQLLSNVVHPRDGIHRKVL